MLSFAERLFQTESNWIIKRVYGNDKMKVKVIQCWICSLQMKNYLFTSPKSIRSVNRYVPYTRFSRRNSIEKVLIVHPYKFCPSKKSASPSLLTSPNSDSWFYSSQQVWEDKRGPSCLGNHSQSQLFECLFHPLWLMATLIKMANMGVSQWLVSIRAIKFPGGPTFLMGFLIKIWLCGKISTHPK